MVKTFFKIALRNLVKNKLYSTVNTLGLAIGITAFILMSMYITYELSYDKFHEDYQSIYRLSRDVVDKNGSEKYEPTPFPLAPYIKDSYAGVADYCRITRIIRYLEHGPNAFYERYGLYADNSFFTMFNFKLVEGDRENPLTEPLSIVLTRELADKYYPNENPIGKTIRINKLNDLKITAIAENPPENTHIEFRYLISYSSFKILEGWDHAEAWGHTNYYSYLRLEPGQSPDQLVSKIKNLASERSKKNLGTLYLQPLSRIHLYTSKVHGALGKKSNIIMIYLFLGIAGLILLIAGFNFINLTTAYSATRAKEVGIKKVVGSHRQKLIKQFIGESTLITFLATITSIILAALFLPTFNSIIHRHLSLSLLLNWQYILAMIIGIILVGTAAGSYPAFYISSFEPTRILRGIDTALGKKYTFRRILVIFQFSISIILIIGAILMSNQLDYLKGKDIGFNKKNLMTARILNSAGASISAFEATKNELLNHPSVLNVSEGGSAPFNGVSGAWVNWEGSEGEDKVRINYHFVDYDFVETYGMEIVKGRDFSRQYAGTDKNGCLINETAARIFAWKDPLGKRLWDNKFRVVGVIKDFHNHTLFKKIRPMILLLKPDNRLYDNGLYSVRVSDSGQKETKELVTEAFKRMFPGSPVEFNFLNDNFDAVFMDALDSATNTFRFFSILTILLAAAGLFSLISFSTLQRTKEIGIRKVLGASQFNIAVMILREFLISMMIALAVAWPIGYYAMKMTFRAFAYRTDISALVFIYSGLIALLVTVLPTIYHTLKLSNTNPITSLRYE